MPKATNRGLMEATGQNLVVRFNSLKTKVISCFQWLVWGLVRLSFLIADLAHGGIGFIQPKDKATTGLYEKVESTAVEAARRKFSPEFMNRLDKVVVFHPLRREQLEQILEIELAEEFRARVRSAAKERGFRTEQAFILADIYAQNNAKQKETC